MVLTCINRKITVLLQSFYTESSKIQNMSKKIQTSKNIDLTQKLIEYLVKGKNVHELPDNVSFVQFSKSDKKLNEANEELLKNISNEDKPVAIAEEPKNKKDSWIITPVNF